MIHCFTLIQLSVQMYFICYNKNKVSTDIMDIKNDSIDKYSMYSLQVF
jgi:hypothetical protein